jgi:hypothetical protein
MNLGKEFFYCVLFFLIALILNLIISASIFWFLNVFIYPGMTGRGVWGIIALLIPVGTYFLMKRIIKNFHLSKEAEGFILYFGLFLIMIFTMPLADFYKVYFTDLKKIGNVIQIERDKSNLYEIQNFRVSGRYRLYSKIREDKKPVRTYFEAYVIFPFESSNSEIYFTNTYRIRSERKDAYSLKLFKFERFKNEVQDSISNFNFYEFNTFERVTKLDYDFNGFNNALLTSDLSKTAKNAVFLKVFDKKDFEKVTSFIQKFIIGIFIFYIVAFWVTRLNEM